MLSWVKLVLMGVLAKLKILADVALFNLSAGDFITIDIDFFLSIESLFFPMIIFYLNRQLFIA